MVALSSSSSKIRHAIGSCYNSVDALIAATRAAEAQGLAYDARRISSKIWLLALELESFLRRRGLKRGHVSRDGSYQPSPSDFDGSDPETLMRRCEEYVAAIEDECTGILAEVDNPQVYAFIQRQIQDIRRLRRAILPTSVRVKFGNEVPAAQSA
ncbi:hypothetical protein [Actomonas aquatica]|uniref:DUF2383 domain-containing protein n=1 Tax=Actomonas aquatica TaxID=2866162 RepID=A0ABZ1C727_9BACT|nr:hypothetical protein [Opitutus sp. WL0086]WRQ87445.1 hypothetical protein K1X11_021740 [Opitutus sp. WL0086]